MSDSQGIPRGQPADGEQSPESAPPESAAPGIVASNIVVSGSAEPGILTSRGIEPGTVASSGVVAGGVASGGVVVDVPPPVGAQDWNPQDVAAALKKRGLSLAGLSVAHGYHPTAAGKALKKPWPAMEQIVAAALGLGPHDIWPNRLEVERKTRSGRGKKPSSNE